MRTQASNVDPSDDFVEYISAAAAKGFSFIPLFGSGMSAPSGIIMGTEFSGYLAYAVYKGIEQGWDFRRHWPAYGTTEDYDAVKKWVLEKYENLCEAYGFHVGFDENKLVKMLSPIGLSRDTGRQFAQMLDRPPVPSVIRSREFREEDEETRRVIRTLRSCQLNEKAMGESVPYEPLWPRLEESPLSDNRLEELAIRSLCDWRATLHFLSRLIRIPGRKKPILDKSDGSVIDRFNAFITADKQPTLGHKVLQHLSRPLRIRTILTTNFDTLIEDAFAQAEMPLEKFSVSKQGGLPDPFELRKHVSIVKMHGERMETRADFTLDDEPNEEDKRRFVQYFYDSAFDSKSRLSTVPSHLLVAGFSGSDLRIIRLIQHLLDSTADVPKDQRPIVFWVTHRGWDTERVEKYFGSYAGRIHIHETVRPDLLMYELYQMITLSLPGGGMTYEYNHNVPPERYGPSKFPVSKYSGFQSAFNQNSEYVVSALKAGDQATEEERRDVRDRLAHIVGHAIAEGVFSEDTSFDRTTEVPGILKLFCIERGSKLEAFADVFQNGGILQPKKIKPQEIVVVDIACGAVEALSIPHAKFIERSGQQSLWFELADYVDADDLLRDIIRSVTLRLGRFQREQVTLHPLRECLEKFSADLRDARMKPKKKSEERLHRIFELAQSLREMCDVYHLSPSSCKLFIYGREVAGSCVGWNGEAWGVASWDAFGILVQSLAAAQFHVVFAKPTCQRQDRENENWTNERKRADQKRSEELLEYEKKLAEWHQQKNPGKKPGTIERNAKELAQEISVAAIGYTKGLPNPGESPKGKQSLNIPFCSELVEPAKRKSLSLFGLQLQAIEKQADASLDDFLYAVTLFRQSRRPSALFFEAVQSCPSRFNISGIDNDAERAIRAKGWTDFLRHQRIFYHKAGGHSWIHRDIRLVARERLEHSTELVKSISGRLEKFRVRFRGQSLSRVHFWIGEWYFRAFCATGFFLPIIESLHHRLQAALAAPFSYPKKPATLLEPNELLHYRFTILRSAILELIKTLIVTRPYLKLWLANKHGFPMFNGNMKDLVAGPLEKAIADLRIGNTKWHKSLRDELNAGIRLLLQSIYDTNQAIIEEATIARGYISLAHPIKKDPGQKEKAPRIELNALMQTYQNEWEEKKHVKHAIRKIFAGDETVRAIQTLLDNTRNENSKWDKDSVSIYAQQKARCLKLLGPSFDNLLPLLKVFAEVLYARVRRAKFLYHTQERREYDPALSPVIRRAWLSVTTLCNLTLDWCKHLPASDLAEEMKLEVRIQCYYGVALANLDRFFEAHRHLNEANGINAVRETGLHKLEIAKIRLRRAEIFLTEAHRLRLVASCVQRYLLSTPTGDDKEFKFDVVAEIGKYWHLNRVDAKLFRNSSSQEMIRVCLHPAVASVLPMDGTKREMAIAFLEDIVRILTATLDDAWIQLEYAEKGLCGQSQSNLWWGRLASMKLRAVGYQMATAQLRKGEMHRLGIQMLAYRNRHVNPSELWSIFERGYLTNDQCNYRRLRLLQYAAEAFQQCVDYGDGTEFIRSVCAKKLRNRLETLEELIGNNDKLKEMHKKAGESLTSLDKLLSRS